MYGGSTSNPTIGFWDTDGMRTQGMFVHLWGVSMVV
jgi:hypothetical protein